MCIYFSLQCAGNQAKQFVEYNSVMFLLYTHFRPKPKKLKTFQKNELTMKINSKITEIID